MRRARPVVLGVEERAVLEGRARARRASARSVQRARIVLMAADGLQDLAIASQLRTTPATVARWRGRFLDGGLAALERDAPRPGRPRTITDRQVRAVVRKTTQETPPQATHWSTRTMAAATGLSEKSVRRIWHAHGLKPHLTRTFKISRDPAFAEKVDAIVGLYLNPPEHAVVLSVDEKSQIQALDRTQPGLPLKRGRCGTMTHDYKRHGTATLFAALDTHDGSVISMCDDRHRHQEWLKFLRVIDDVHAARQGTASDRRQRLHAQARQGATLAGAASAVPRLLHTHQQLVAQHGGTLLPRPHATPAAPRGVPRCRGTDHGDRGLCRSAQRTAQAVHLDGHGHRHPGQGGAGAEGAE